MTCKTYCKDNISRKLFYLTIVTDRKMNCIYEHDRIYFIKRAILPFFYLWEQPVGIIRHHSVTYFKAVNILNSFAYLTGRHTFIGVLAAILVPSMMGYVGDSKLSTANSNAKLVYTNTATYCTNCEVAGYTVASGSAQVNLTGGSAGGNYAKDGSDLSNALCSLMGGSPSSGVATVVISSAGVPERTAWAKTTADKYVGGYPVAATIAKNGSGASETWIKIEDATTQPGT